MPLQRSLDGRHSRSEPIGSSGRTLRITLRVTCSLDDRWLDLGHRK
jgi:hypothetical protein